jgi:hypothetical protein
MPSQDGLSAPPGVCAPDIRSAGPREQPASSGRIASVMAGIDAKGETLTSWLGKLCLAINVSAVKTRGRSPQGAVGLTISWVRHGVALLRSRVRDGPVPAGLLKDTSAIQHDLSPRRIVTSQGGMFMPSHSARDGYASACPDGKRPVPGVCLSARPRTGAGDPVWRDLRSERSQQSPSPGPYRISRREAPSASPDIGAGIGSRARKRWRWPARQQDSTTPTRRPPSPRTAREIQRLSPDGT